MNEIIDEILTVREYINKGRKRNILLKDKFTWNQVCSSMDIIEDTELAINDYLKIKNVKSDGLKYLYVFGILQVLFVQQDAIKNLSEALNLNVDFDDQLLKIRDIRNNSIGHPTKKGKGKSAKYNFIVRFYLTHKNLTIMNVSPKVENSSKFLHYDIYKLIMKQRESIIPILNFVLTNLEKEEMENKEKFKGEKLTDCFHPTLSYHFQKVGEARWGERPIDIAKIDFDVIEKTLDQFKSKLKARDIFEAYDSITLIFDELTYPMSKLKSYFHRESNLDPENITIYNHYIKSKFTELNEMAQELDESYNNE